MIILLTQVVFPFSEKLPSTANGRSPAFAPIDSLHLRCLSQSESPQVIRFLASQITEGEVRFSLSQSECH
jgi:hypothetical protein